MQDKEKVFGGSLVSAGGAVLLLLILILVNLILARTNLRWDATQDQLYSLSNGTRQILANLTEDVTIKVFYSKSNPNIPVNIKTYARRMIDFLFEYEYQGKGKIRIEILDPVIDSEEEEWAQKYGIEGIDLPTGERIYFGLVVMAADQEETIAMMDPTDENHLEYDITRMVARVQSPKHLKIGIISGLPIFGSRPAQFGMPNPSRFMSPWLFISEMKKTYNVEEISLSSKTVGADVDLLILVHPKGLSGTLQYAVDQYVLSGRNVIVFADPLSVMDASPDRTGASSLKKLFTAWGVTMDRSKVLIDMNNSTRLMTSGNRPEDNPLWLSLGPESFNPNDIITTNLETMLLPVAGAIKKIPESGFEYEPLLQSSVNSALTDSFKARYSTDEIRRDFTPSNEKYDLAVKIRGVFKTAFPEGKPTDDEENPQGHDDEPLDKMTAVKEKSLINGNAKSAIIIVADADMLFDGYYVHKQNFLGFDISRIFNDNLNFLLNAGEMLVGGEELISIRSRGKFERPFTRVQALEEKAQAKWLIREQELIRKVEATNQRLRQLEQQKDSSQKFIISQSQETEIKEFQQEKQRINKELKDVRRKLRVNIESLGNRVKFINIFLMPLLISIIGIIYGLYKRRKAQ
jgi:ABC-type uncharacterized transport system involved in gliding motility auxiliary subunit